MMIDSLEELCSRLAKSRRDPEFTPLEYLSEILRRLQAFGLNDTTL